LLRRDIIACDARLFSPAEHATVINPRPAMALGEKGLKPRHLLVR
jgi:hypothetical protein